MTKLKEVQLQGSAKPAQLTCKS